ncbi:hypothetical protein Q8A64_02940 [Oxalobacteraceae bacterium R-40]|uniref:Uncharacterized protein n=1 Tax=Keguizhuia sedimenti TaxID=3064264 RepID=A0ABU1BKG2_9BURK|nr:hypothetical protein [Oxalobacteraceae bacterium R-40]
MAGKSATIATGSAFNASKGRLVYLSKKKIVANSVSKRIQSSRLLKPVDILSADKALHFDSQVEIFLSNQLKDALSFIECNAAPELPFRLNEN